MCKESQEEEHLSPARASRFSNGTGIMDASGLSWLVCSPCPKGFLAAGSWPVPLKSGAVQMSSFI